jgi:hypothetical protein
LVAEAEIERLAREAVTVEARKNLLRGALEFAEQALGAELWAELKPHFGEVEQQRNRDERVGGVTLGIEVKGEALEMTPFEIVVRFGEAYYPSRVSIRVDGGRQDYDVFGGHTDHVQNKAELGKALLTLRKAYPGWREALIKRVSEPLVKRLEYGRSSGTTPEEAQQLGKQLMEIDPTQGERWAALTRSFLEAHQAWERRKAEEAAQEATVKAAEEKYRAEYAAYRQKLTAARAANELRVKQIQEQVNRPYTVYELTYAMVGRDEEDGVLMVETCRAWVMSPEADENGFYQRVTHGGRVEMVKYSHVVAVTRLELRPEDDGGATCGWAGIPNAQVDTKVYYPPEAGEETRKLIAEMGWEPIPEAPSAPEELPDWKASDIRHEIFEKSEPWY